MVNQRKKSTCQLRLEARSLAYQQKQQQEVALSDQHDRIARASEIRGRQERQRRAVASARVQHALRVAAETRARRREELLHSRVAVREKVEVARQRRQEALARQQEVCKRRVALVLEKVETVKATQRCRAQRQRRQLEDQLVDAARRREEQTQKMVRRLSERWQCVETVKDRVQRIKYIQRWYRRHVEARKAAFNVQTVKAQTSRLMLCWQQISGSSFEDSMRLLQDRDLARAAQHVLRVLLPSAITNGSQSPTKEAANASPRANKSAPFRVLLMVGMVAAHPNEIMESNRSERLVFASKGVLRDVDRIVRCLQDESPNARALKTIVSQLEARFHFYFESFSLWKESDAERLAQEMLRGYMDIYRTKVHYAAQDVQHAGDGMHQLLAQTEKQLAQLRSALMQVIGREDAVTRVQAVEESVNAESAAPTQEMEVEQEPSPVSKHDTNRTVSHCAPAEREDTPPPAQVVPLLSDEKLVHELILNPSFRLPMPSAGSSTVQRVRMNMLKAFWDQVVASNDVDSLVSRVNELRSLFADVCKARPSLIAAVDEALNPEALRSMLMHGSLDSFAGVKSRCVRVLQLILEAEAPARNASTTDFAQSLEDTFRRFAQGDERVQPLQLLVDFLAFTFEKVEEIRVDALNAHLDMLAAYLVHHGVDYEQKKLTSKLQSGASMPMTEKWLATEVQSVLRQLDDNDKARLRSGDAAISSRVYRRSMMTLVTKYIDGTSGVWPESFALDVERIRSFRDTLDRVVIVSSLLITVQDHVARQRSSLPRGFFASTARDLTDLLNSPGITGGHLVSKLVDEVKQISNGEPPAEAMQELERRLVASFQPGNAVSSVFSGRLTGAVQDFVTEERSELEVHPSLAPFESDLQAVAMSMRKLFKHNEVVHAQVYNRIVQHLVASS
ncbi:hypothetical protein PINS_up009877 [Pythium insidiosum]|nr:hypothetical protein PINS_up009877 [Pythium insidiosum]